MNVQQMLHERIDALERHGDRPAVVSFQGESARRTSYEDLARRVRRLAAGLLDAGLPPSLRVALLARPDADWIAACLAIIRAGGVVVPLDVQMDDDALRHVLQDSQPCLILTDQRRAARLSRLEGIPETRIAQFDAEDEATGWTRFLADSPPELPQATLDQNAILFYTSGTTGAPKGVPLTHGNLASQLDVLVGVGIVSRHDRVLLPLPLHHVYPLVVGTLLPLARGLCIILPASLVGPQLVRALREGEVTAMIGVPRLYRALYEGVQQRVASRGRVARGMFHLGLRTSMYLRKTLGVQVGKLLFRPLHRQFAPALRIAAAGGSALDESLAWKLEGLGWKVVIGYGLTETSPLLAMSPPNALRFDTVGRAVPGVELCIDPSSEEESEEGEILARGPGVFAGYRNLPRKTAEAFTSDGWFRTGDVGFLDSTDHLHVTGRKGTMIVTESGENVQPDQLEKIYGEQSAIEEIGVLEDEGQLVGLIVPARDVRGQNEKDVLHEAVDAASSKLASYQRLGDFRSTGTALPRTRLGKIQRHKLREHYQQAADTAQRDAQGAITPSEMSSDDQLLLEKPTAREIWDLLVERYPQHRLTPDTHLARQLDIDSLAWINLSLAIRKQTGLEIRDEVLERIETVRDLLNEAAAESAAPGQAKQKSPLEQPIESLRDDERKYLKPPNRAVALVAHLLLGLNWLAMRLLFRLQVRGRERLPDQPVLLAPNHASYLDTPALAAAFPLRYWSTTCWGGWTGALFRNTLMRLLSRLGRIVPVDPRGGALSSLKVAAAVLEQGNNLVWFPEGQRSADGRLQPFRPGIGLLLHHHPVKVVPVAIEGAHDALPPGARLIRLRKIRVTFGRPLQVSKLLDAHLQAGKQPDRERRDEQITAAVRQAVEVTMTGQP